MFVPFLQISGTLIQAVPPFLTRIAWRDAWLLGAALTAALATVVAVSLLLLRRLNMFEVVKLGE